MRDWPLVGACDCTRGSNLEAHAFRLLQVGNDCKQIAGGGIALWAKHLVKGLYVDTGMRGQHGKADCGVDVITQELFAECHFAREKALDRLA